MDDWTRNQLLTLDAVSEISIAPPVLVLGLLRPKADHADIREIAPPADKRLGFKV